MRKLKKEFWPCRVVVGSDWKKDITAIEIWLGKEFGTFKDRWYVIYQNNETHFYFRNQKDASWFALRWS